MKKLKMILTATLFASLTVTSPKVRADVNFNDESPPPAEAPYPNAPEEGFAQKLPPPIPEPVDGAVKDALIGDPMSEDVSNEPLTEIKKSTRVSRAETNAPEIDAEIPKDSGPSPVKKNSDGSYFYGHTDDSGEYRYKAVRAKEVNYNEKDTPPKNNNSSSLRFAYFGAPDLKNPQSGLFFKDIYSAQNYPSVLYDYEWKITHSIGDVGVKFGTGLFYANGKGRWVDADRRNDTEQPLEKFTFFMLPNTLSGVYRFRYADRQVIVPYVEAGPGLFTFAETRDDSKGPKFGAALAAFASGGINILIDGLDRDAMRNMRKDYAINHIYLNAEFREIYGLNNKFDFSSRVLCGGLGAEF